mgnify:CR=1 FL=1
MCVVNNGGQCGAGLAGRLGHPVSYSSAVISSMDGREKLGDVVRHAEKPSRKKQRMCHARWTSQLVPIGQNAHKILNRINCDNTSPKWGEMDEILLNGIISVKIGGKMKYTLHLLWVRKYDSVRQIETSVINPHKII